MKLYKITFSPTGGTQKAADLLVENWKAQSISVDLTDPNAHFSDVSLTAEDVAVISVPSYAGRVPAPAVQRLTAMQGNGARAVLVCVYGNRAYEDTLVELEDAAVQAIDPADPSRTDKELCISCMRCVAVCPKGARKVNPVMLTAAQVALKKVCSDRKEGELFL